MRWIGLVVLLACAGLSLAQEQEIQRALIERDQQSAAFAAGIRGPSARHEIESLHAAQRLEAQRPLPLNAVPSHHLAVQRARMAQERELRFAPPLVRPEPGRGFAAPLPLPGGRRAGVDPVAPDRLPY